MTGQPSAVEAGRVTLPDDGWPVDTRELEDLVERSYPRILRAALVLTGDRCDGEDLAQETFLQALGASRRFAGKSKPETWIYSILLNLHRKRLRSRSRRWRRWLGWFERSRKGIDDRSPGGRIEHLEWQETLWCAVKDLPEAQQHAIVLRYSEGLSYEEISEVLSCPIGTAKTRVHHGVSTLRARFKDDVESTSQPSTVDRATGIRS